MICGFSNNSKRSYQLSAVSFQPFCHGLSGETRRSVRDFRKLQVWEKAHELTLAVYRSTSGFPKDELYGLTSQIRRASSSIPANIAEGCGREGDAEFKRFLQIALGSASELEYHLLLAHDLGYIDQGSYIRLEQNATEVKRMLTGFIQRLKADG
jgi:four helix bundle protein